MLDVGRWKVEGEMWKLEGGVGGQLGEKRIFKRAGEDGFGFLGGGGGAGATPGLMAKEKTQS